MKTFYYSLSTEGFYVSDLHTSIPTDVIEITEAYWQELLAGQSSGKKISPGENGYPVLTDYPIPEYTYAELRSMEYPGIGEQLDLLWHMIDQGNIDKTSSFYTTLANIKNKYPKV